VRVPAVLLAQLRNAARRRSLILCYHGIAATTVTDDPSFFCVDPRRLRWQVALLQATGFRFVTVSDLVDAGPAHGAPPPPGLVALSFDDGWQDNHANLLPLLRSSGIPATIFVTSGLLGLPNPWIRREAGMRMMTADEVRECAAAGVEIGAHTVTHPDLSLVSAAGCEVEIGPSRTALQQITQTEVRTFAYPYFHHSPEAVAAVRAAGFVAAAAGVPDDREVWDRFGLPRTLITGKDGLPSFALKVLGRYERLWASPAGETLRITTRGPRRLIRLIRDGHV
jgi:peptidoglycan/xylan/chitin deacetylase (PgdA/CDA1 family)